VKTSNRQGGGRVEGLYKASKEKKYMGKANITFSNMDRQTDIVPVVYEVLYIQLNPYQGTTPLGKWEVALVLILKNVS